MSKPSVIPTGAKRSGGTYSCNVCRDEEVPRLRFASLGMTGWPLPQQPLHHLELDLRRLDHLADRNALVRRMALRARARAEVDDLDPVVGVVAAVAHAGRIEELHLPPGLLLHRRLEGA